MQLTLFGKFSLVGQSHQLGISKLQDSPKLQELLAYLIIHADRLVAREEVGEEIWYEMSASQAYDSACKALAKLESLISQENLHILNYPEGVRWDRNPNLWVDVHQLDAAFNDACASVGKSIDQESLARLLVAADLYRGPFLDGCYSPWCSETRNILEQKFLQFLELLMDACEKRGAYDTGIGCGLRAIALEHSRETTHWRLMHLFYLAGDRTAALRQYQRCAEALAGELGIDPGETTVALYKQIQGGGQLPLAPPDTLPTAFQITLTNLHVLDQVVSQLQAIQLRSVA